GRAGRGRSRSGRTCERPYDSSRRDRRPGPAVGLSDPNPRLAGWAGLCWGGVGLVGGVWVPGHAGGPVGAPGSRVPVVVGARGPVVGSGLVVRSGRGGRAAG